ncbi:hypothetical protein Nepgr_010306 [Nepenthes gracilis]|uniref:Epidermal patterning factor-like protein n=1 Tax=Nepenthes gracilis TaxID=150966 RepID=A0AAD3SCW8_NEPGR|nr:hypothetical protein Nepgr_010306 [Nepenthes gracilis]
MVIFSNFHALFLFIAFNSGTLNPFAFKQENTGTNTRILSLSFFDLDSQLAEATEIILSSPEFSILPVLLYILGKRKKGRKLCLPLLLISSTPASERAMGGLRRRRRRCTHLLSTASAAALALLILASASGVTGNPSRQLGKSGDISETNTATAQASWLSFWAALNSGRRVRKVRIESVFDAVMTRRRLVGPGSSPPTCRSKCGRCSPCKAVHVPIQPGVSTPLEYYPEAWRCKCEGDSLAVAGYLGLEGALLPKHPCLATGATEAAWLEREAAKGATGAKAVVKGATSARVLACEPSNPLSRLKLLPGFEASLQLANTGAEDPPSPLRWGGPSYIGVLRPRLLTPLCSFCKL